MSRASDVAQRLRNQTSALVNAFKERARRIRAARELERLLKPLDRDAAVKAAYEYFGPGEYTAVGVDGSMQADELLEMLIFYANATAYKCTFKVSQDGLSFDLKHAERDSSLSVSATVPLWMDDLPEVAGATSIDTDYQLSAAASRIPFAVMTMAELKTAYSAASSKDVRIVFMDRPLSGTFSSFARDYRDLLRSGQFALSGFETPHGKLSLLDMVLAYNLGSGEEPPPRRERFLPYAVVRKLLDGEPHSVEELRRKLGVDDATFKKALKRLRKLDSRFEGALLSRGGGEGERELQLTSYAANYWKRVSYALGWVLEKIFSREEHPLLLDGDKLLTARELNAFNILLIYELKKLSSRNRVLVVGIAKDTASTEFGRAIVPYATSGSGLPGRVPLRGRSDRSLLGILSTSEGFEVKTPWRTAGYDAAFTTLVFREGEGPSLAAVRKRAGVEGRFVRAYFQLRSLETDPRSKSPVFLYDRFQDDAFDQQYRRVTRVAEAGGACDLVLYFEGEHRNPLDEMILLVLSLADNPSVAEAFGHNQLLFLADKAAKAEGRQARSMLRGIVELELGPITRSDRMFNIARRFRDIRAEYERARESSGGGGGS